MRGCEPLPPAPSPAGKGGDTPSPRGGGGRGEGFSRRAFLRTLLTGATTGLALACAPALPIHPFAVPAATPLPRPTRSASTSDANAGPRSGGALTYVLPGEPVSLDPALGLSPIAETIGRAIFDRLIELGPGGELRPGLAERWAASDDGLRLTFHLRGGATFHDGTPCDARAAKYSLERLIGEDRPPAGALVVGLVGGVRAVGTLDLEIQLRQPYSTAARLFAQYGTSIVSPEAHTRRRAIFGHQPIGSGPFRFVERTGGVLRLERWDDGPRGKPLLDELVFHSAPDERARLELLERDEAQLAGLVSPDVYASLAEVDGLAADLLPTARVLGISINTQAPPFTDRRVRQALNYAIDKDALARSAFDGLASPLGGPVAPSVPGAAPLAPYAYDPDRAKQLLTNAGFPGAIDFPLIGPRGRFWRDEALLREVQRQLEAVGVKTRIELLDSVAYTTEITKAPDETTLRLALVGWFPRTLELRAALRPLFHSTQWLPGGQNTAFFRNAQFDDLLDRAARALETEERDRHYRRAQELLREEVPWIWLLSPGALVARSSAVREPLLLPSEVVTVGERSWLGE